MGQRDDFDAWAIRPCLYDGRPRERGECLRLAGIPTDQRLIDEHYLQRLQPKHQLYTCVECGKGFVASENFNLHEKSAHPRARSGPNA